MFYDWRKGRSKLKIDLLQCCNPGRGTFKVFVAISLGLMIQIDLMTCTYFSFPGSTFAN